MQNFTIAAKPIMLNDGATWTRVNPDKIVYFKANRMHCIVKVQDGEDIILNRPLREVEAAMPKGMFIRINQSEMINPFQVKKVIHRQVWLNGDIHVHIVSDNKTYCDSLKDAFILLPQRYGEG